MKLNTKYVKKNIIIFGVMFPEHFVQNPVLNNVKLKKNLLFEFFV